MNLNPITKKVFFYYVNINFLAIAIIRNIAFPTASPGNANTSSATTSNIITPIRNRGPLVPKTDGVGQISIAQQSASTTNFMSRIIATPAKIENSQIIPARDVLSHSNRNKKYTMEIGGLIVYMEALLSIDLSETLGQNTSSHSEDRDNDERVMNDEGIFNNIICLMIEHSDENIASLTTIKRKGKRLIINDEGILLFR